MPHSLKSFLALFALVFLLGCALPGNVNLPFSAPKISPSPEASATPEPNSPNLPGTVLPPSQPTAAETLPPNPTQPTINPTLRVRATVTPTSTLDPTNILLRIAAPGPMSKVASPITFVTYISPDYTGITRVQLLGENGRELYSKAFRTFSNIGSTTRVEEHINFEIHDASEVGRLQISTVDEHGIMQAYNSVRVLLLSVGDSQLTQAYAPLERVLLRLPKGGDEIITGGDLNVQGQIQPVNDTPVIFELYDSNGKIIGSRILTLQHADGNYQSFNTIIPYQVGQKTTARLVVRQADDRITGLAYLYSEKLSIAP